MYVWYTIKICSRSFLGFPSTLWPRPWPSLRSLIPTAQVRGLPCREPWWLDGLHDSVPPSVLLTNSPLHWGFQKDKSLPVVAPAPHWPQNLPVSTVGYLGVLPFSGLSHAPPVIPLLPPSGGWFPVGSVAPAGLSPSFKRCPRVSGFVIYLLYFYSVQRIEKLCCLHVSGIHPPHSLLSSALYDFWHGSEELQPREGGGSRRLQKAFLLHQLTGSDRVGPWTLLSGTVFYQPVSPGTENKSCTVVFWFWYTLSFSSLQ